MDGKNTVMLVEDDEDTRTLLAEYLEFEGFRVIGFPNGAQALEYLEHSEPPAVIVLDMRMPVMDGAQFRSALLERPKLANIPAFVVTAFDQSAAARLSVQKVFRKPVDLDAFVTALRRYC